MTSPHDTNLIVVAIDTLRYDHVSANPGAVPEIDTPNFDRFADDAWTFTNAYISSYPTIAARHDLLTGRYGAPFHQWTPLGYERQTLPESLSEVGYVTQLIHDTPHLVNGGHRFDGPFHAWTPIRGAEVDRPWITDTREWLQNWAFDDRFDRYDIDRQGVFADNHILSRYVDANRDRDGHEDWNVAKLFRTASRFLEDNAARENFFLWVDCFDPHEPWDAPPEFVERYDADGDGRLDPRSFREAVRNDSELSEAAKQHLRAQYRAKVTFVDHWFGTLLDTLDETGLVENTAVLVIGDHGTNLDDQPDRGFGKSAPPLQNEAHVPLFLSLPSASSGRCDLLVQPQDVFATIAGIGGAQVPEQVASNDLREIIQNGREPREIAISGRAVGEWADAGPDDVLFTAFDGEWCLGVTLDPEQAPLWKIGEYYDIAENRGGVVERLHAAALDEIERRGLDPSLSQWLRQGGGPFPEDARTTDSPSRPDGWRLYWSPTFYK